jgi:hypothetical protein
MAQYVSGRQPFLNVGIPGITTNTRVLDITGRVGVGVTNPTADVDLNTIRIRQSLFDVNNFSGELGYFLTRDAVGLKWVNVPAVNNNALFVSQNSVILGVSSYTGINFVSDGNDLVGISTNLGNPNIVDVRISSRWNKDGNTGIYTSKFVGIGSTTPTVAIDVVGDGKFTGIVTAGKFSGQSGIITGNVEVGSLRVTGISTFIGVTTFSKVGIGTTTIPRTTLDVGGDVWVSGAVTALSFTAENFYGTISTAKYADLAGIATNISLASTTSTDNTSYLVLVGSSATTIQQPFIDSNSLSYDGQTDTLNSDNIKVGFITATNAWIGVATINDLKVVNDVFRVGTAITMSNGIITATTFNGKFLDFEFLTVSGIASINIGIVTNLSISGITTINTGIVTNLSVSGIASINTGIITNLSISGIASINTGIVTNLSVSGITTINTGIATNLSVSGITTINTGIVTNLSVSGIATINTGIVTNLKVSGFSTFIGIATFSTVGIGTTNIIGSDKLTIIGDTRIGGQSDTFRVGTAITMSNGIITATTFSGKLLDFEFLKVSGITTVGTGDTGVVIDGTTGIITSIRPGVTTVTFVGNLTGTASTASFATTAFNLDNALSTRVGFATTAFDVIGGIASVTSLFVNTAGISTLGTVKISSGIITSTTGGIVTYFGDGSKLTGVSGVKVEFQDLIGNPVYPTLANNSGVSSIGISTIGDNALAFIPFSGRLGIGTTVPTEKLDVNGDIRLRGGLYDSNNNIGDPDTILVSDGTNVVWSTLGQLGGSDITIQEDNITSIPQYLVFTNVTSGSSYTEKVSPTKLTYVASRGNLGIGTSLPFTPLQVETYGVKTGFGTFIASAGITTDVDSFSISSVNFKTAEYTVHIESSSSIQAQKVLVMQNGIKAFSQEYGIMYEPTFMVSIGATVSGGLCKLQFTPETGISGLLSYRFTRETMI